MSLKAVAFGLFVLFACSSPALAGPITSFSSSAAFGGNDTIDWGVLGGDGTTLGSSLSMSWLGLDVSSGHDMHLYDEGGSWNGHFAAGDHVLHSGNGSGPLRFTFDSPVYGLGFNTHANAWGDFAATLEIFGTGGSLGSFSVNGFGGLCASCNDAPFLGLKSGAPEIVSAILTMSNDRAGFALSSLLLDRGPTLQILDRGPDFEILDRVPNPSVPEPSTLALSTIGVALVLYRRRRR